MQRVRNGIILHSMILIRSKIEAAIILKIWRNTLSRRLCRFAIRVIAESGLLYTLTIIAVFCTQFSTAESAFYFQITNAIVCHYKCFWVHI